AVLLVAVLPFTAQPARKEKLVLAVQPTQNPAQILERAERLKGYLSSRLGVEVEVYVPTSYAAVVEALRFGTAQAALMGSWPAAIAVKTAGAQVVLAEVRRVYVDDRYVEGTFYYSYWIVRPDSPYTKLEDLRGKSACFPSPISSSGYLAPMARMVELGLLSRKDGGAVDPKDFFSEVYFAGGYAQCYEALMAGRVEVTVMAGDVSKELYERAMSSTRVIEKQGPLPSHALVVSKNLDPKLREALIEAFLDLNTPDGAELMRNLVSAIFVRWERRTSEEHLSALDRYIELTGLEFKG
ncbi:MAG: phosphate/phosphite/phosphonate ABC transporter substrate-binding protein, partial [Nitrososphaerota archaeon]